MTNPSRNRDRSVYSRANDAAPPPPRALVHLMDRHELQVAIDEIHVKYSRLTDGQVATYIPELGKACPEHFGVALATANGQLYEVGDCDQSFTIQSISKPFTFGLALETFGPATVAQRVGVEPSGDAFNAISLQSGTNRPHNPMINAGAITVTALLHSRFGDETFDLLLDRLSVAAGHQLYVDEAVYESERRTGHRNRAIAHLLLNFGMVHEEAEHALDVYFRQCAITLTCRDLAVMGATLANMGRNPLTGHSAFEIESVKRMLAIMFTCGMYDYSGEWAYRVGVPAKSGVSGGVVAVVNRQLGIATYSPRLDARGNSARGIEACQELAARFGLHAFDCLNQGSSYLEGVL
jgi:glutaminase